MARSEAWQRKEGKNPEGGLNKKGVASYRAANPGSKLKTAVTTKPSKLKAGSKSANRRKSFCSRMGGMKKRLTSAKTANDPNSRINKSLRKWNCEDGGYIETKNTGGIVMPKGPGTYGSKVGRPKKRKTSTMAGGGKIKKRSLMGNPLGTYMDEGGYTEAYGDTKYFQGKKKDKPKNKSLKDLIAGSKNKGTSEFPNIDPRTGKKSVVKEKNSGKTFRSKKGKTLKERTTEFVSPGKAKLNKSTFKPGLQSALRPMSSKDKKIEKVESKKMKPIKKESRWSKLKSKFKSKKVEAPKTKKRNVMNIKKLKADTPTGIKKKKISDWQGKKTKLTAKQKKAKADAYKSPMTGVEEAAAKKSKDDFKTGASKADLYTPVDQSKGVSKAKTVTRKDTTVKTKGGDFPVYRKGTTSSKSFSKSFNAARNPKTGKMPKSFTWQGRSYSTRKAGEGKNFDATTGKWGKAKKMQMGGMVDTPETQAFKQGIKYMKSGGRVSVSNDNSGAGDIAHVHSHSGYKAGE